MARRKRKTDPVSATQPLSWQSHKLALFSLVFFLTLTAAAYIYGPALHSPFVFDDSHLPFHTTVADRPLSFWLSAGRPVLMFSYWVNYRLGGSDPFGFHVVNLLIHAVNAGLVYLVLLRLLNLAGWSSRSKSAISAIGALIFLIHPLQTESVTYVAGRSESLASLFMLLAYVVFLYRTEEAISWREAIAVVLLFGIAVSTKENAAALAGVLILTDVFWPRPFSTGRLRMNWRLYALMAPAFLAALVQTFRVLSRANSAGYSLNGLGWQQYGLTEARALFRYIQLAVFPVGQSLDHDYPISKTLWDHGAIWFLALWVLLLAAAFLLRRRLPLTCFGLLMYLILLAPTSSIVPLLDPLVERRMYLALAALILIGCELFARLNLPRPVLVSVVTTLVLFYGEFGYERNVEWGNPEKLFASATKECVRNMRPYVMLTEYLIQQNRCRSAIPYLEEASRKTRDASIYVSWGRALECVGDRDGALQKLQQAAQLQPDSSQVFQLIGLLYGEMKMPENAGLALRRAVEVAPNSTSAHDALGLWYESEHDIESAENEYKRGAALDPNDWESRVALTRIRALKSPERGADFEEFIPQ